MAAACLKIRRSVFSCQIGEIIAEVQRVPLGDLSYIEPRWDQFIPGQIEGCRGQARAPGIAAAVSAGLDDLLRDAATLIP
jgi:hygromycin-B 7''-O-kinase